MAALSSLAPTRLGVRCGASIQPTAAAGRCVRSVSVLVTRPSALWCCAASSSSTPASTSSRSTSAQAPRQKQHQQVGWRSSTLAGANSDSFSEKPVDVGLAGQGLGKELSRALQALRLVPQRWVNGTIVATVLGSVAYEVFTVDSDYWLGWTAWEVLSRLPQDNWEFYQDNLAHNPEITSMLITGLTYYLADWIAQTYEGNALLEFNASRLLRSTITGLLFLGPLAHTYYTVQDDLFAAWYPTSPWYSEVMKMAIDATAYCFVYNFIYYLCQGLLKGSSLQSILLDFKGAWWRLQKAGWRIWPYVGVITHTLIPTEHKVLFVDVIEVGWVTYLSVAANSMRAKNLENVRDVFNSQEGEIQGPEARQAREALETFVSEVRETKWESELAPTPEDAVAVRSMPSDSIPQDHLLLAIELESAMDEKLTQVMEAATSEEASVTTATAAVLAAADDSSQADASCPIEELMAEELATMMQDTDSSEPGLEAAAAIERG